MLCVESVRNIREKINISGEIRVQEPMSRHTSFNVGGAADLYTAPLNMDELVMIGKVLKDNPIPRFILGKGANILVSDAGIRGLVIDMKHLDSYVVQDERIILAAGLEVSKAARIALEHQLSGLEFIYGMPGSVGGSIYMNARCYGVSVSDLLAWVDVLDQNLTIRRVYPRDEDFGYKKTPFQTSDEIIIRGCFQLAPDTKERILRRMEHNKRDRLRKGHFDHPSAGSVFKNNRAFGAPTGKLIDSLGLRGYRSGDAAVSLKHANIIINQGHATAKEIRDLVEYVQTRVYEAYGYSLEREIIYVGEQE